MKERLTGAIILVALLVLLVPELLTGPESKTSDTAGGAESAQLRSYTIDLNDEAANRQPPPPQAPVVAAVEEPTGQATQEPDAAESPAASVEPPATNVDPPADGSARAAGKPLGSGADAPAAAPEAPEAAAATAVPPKPAAPAAEDDRPRSAFGPNARPPPEKAPSVARPAPEKAESPRQSVAKAESPKADGPRSGGTKGWAVQLGVFGSRGNADRLAKQVRGSGFPVLINETSGKDGKKLYWVRVGPEAEQAGAVALSAKLKAAGHRDARVVAYP